LTGAEQEALYGARYNSNFPSQRIAFTRRELGSPAFEWKESQA